MQIDRSLATVVGEMRTKQQSLEDHQTMAASSPAMQKSLSTEFGLHPTPSPLLAFSFDAFRYVMYRCNALY